MVGDAASLRHQERVLTPFFVSRNVGAKILHVIANQRMTMAAGVFNDVSRPQLVGHTAMEARRRLGPHVARPLRQEGRERQRPDPHPMDLLNDTPENWREHGRTQDAQ